MKGHSFPERGLGAIRFVIYHGTPLRDLSSRYVVTTLANIGDY
jgi:hypothetical protein